MMDKRDVKRWRWSWSQSVDNHAPVFILDKKIYILSARLALTDISVFI